MVSRFHFAFAVMHTIKNCLHPIKKDVLGMTLRTSFLIYLPAGCDGGMYPLRRG